MWVDYLLVRRFPIAVGGGFSFVQGVFCTLETFPDLMLQLAYLDMLYQCDQGEGSE